MKKALMFCVFLLALGVATISSAQETPATAMENYIAAFDYDRSLPLNAEVKEESASGGRAIYEVWFDSANGERVPAKLYLPTAKEPPYPAVVVQHGYGMDKEFGSLFSGILAPKGLAVISIDAEYHGQRKEEGKDIFSVDADDDERALIQTVIDLRRTIDYLELRDDIDASRIGYTGASMGGMLGGILFGAEDRVRTAVLIVGGGDWITLVSTSQVDAFQTIREYVAEHGITVEEFVDGWDEVDPVNLIGNAAPRPLLMINCENDKYVPKKAGEALYEAAGEPKDIRWFTCDGDIAHFPPMDKTISLVGKWFSQFLKPAE